MKDKNHMAKEERKINKEELQKLIKPRDLRSIIRITFCHNCLNTTIINYEDSIYVNHLNDAILRGKCKKCGGPVARYIKTGEIEK